MPKGSLKSLLFLLLLLNSRTLLAKTIVIGNGSGIIKQNSMDGLEEGDVLAITPGTYTGAEFSHLRNISIVNHGGLVVFTGTISLTSLYNTTISGTGTKKLFYGFRFDSLKSRAFSTSGNFYGLRIYNCEFINVSDIILDVSDNDAKYTGDTSTIKLYKTTLANLHMVKCGLLLEGFYGTPDKLTDIIDSIAIFYIKIDTTIANGQAIAAGAIYRMDIHDWKVNNFALNPSLSGDVGLIHTNGNGRVYNIYRHGGRGYIWREWNTGLNGVSESYIYNVIDLATNAYGFIDTRIDQSYFTGGDKIPFTTGGNMHIVNNTIGNKSDNRYVAPVVIMGFQGPYKTEVRNNLAFNIKGSIMINNSSADYNPNDSSSNIQFSADQILSVLSDTVLCLIKQKPSSIVDQGTPIPFLKTDIGGVKRPRGEGFDIGARECL